MTVEEYSAIFTNFEYISVINERSYKICNKSQIVRRQNCIELARKRRKIFSLPNMYITRRNWKIVNDSAATLLFSRSSI